MISLEKLRSRNNPKVLVFGNHQGIIQSILDFDFLAGKVSPSVIGIVGVQHRNMRYFFGDQEILIPGFVKLEHLGNGLAEEIDLFVVAQSGRRAIQSSEEAVRVLTNSLGGIIFAEGVPEKHAIELRRIIEKEKKFILGPASVGMALGGHFKLGAIAGTLPEQISGSGICHLGNIAVISTSGGMINEIISLVSKSGRIVSFAAAVGGERFPLVKPVELVKEALSDKRTKALVYFGELGGTDEYEIAELIKNSPIKKPVVAYVAGVFAEKFDSAPQFGHAKALAQSKSETATSKKNVLRNAGVQVADSFAQFEELINSLPQNSEKKSLSQSDRVDLLNSRIHKLFNSEVTTDKGDEVKILGVPLTEFTHDKLLSEIALSMFLGHEPSSKRTTEFFDTCVKLLVDHGPQVSGAVNVMITARAGKDLSSALSSGLLTIGPRFGGAINQAARNWHDAVLREDDPAVFVEKFAIDRKYIPGIGHKKYRADNPDPRVSVLINTFEKNAGRHISFAKGVERITTGKKAQLILNVDGAIAALMLDLLETEEKYNQDQTSRLIDSGFFNAIFVYARTTGFIAHYLEQKRLDEGLFRLPDNLI